MSSRSIVRVGVIGTGAMGTAHVKTLDRWVPGAHVVAVYDADSDRAKQVAHDVGAVVTDSAHELVEHAQVDAVVLAAPDSLHEELALACLAAGKFTLLEKPLATTLEGSRRVVEAELAGDRRLLQLGFMRRYDASFVALRGAVLSGRVGDVRAVHCLHRNAQAHPTATSEGVLVNSMIHEFDHIPWLLDDPIAAVTVFAPRVPDGALKDVQIAVLETLGGVVATVEVSVNARYGYDVQTEVTGTKGAAALTPPYGLALRQGGLDGREVGDDFVARFVDAYRLELSAWIEGVRTEALTGPSAWDGYRANATAFAAVRSLGGAGRVEVPQEQQPALYRADA